MVLKDAPSAFSKKSKFPVGSTMQIVTSTFSSLALASDAATIVLMAVRLRYFLLGRSAADTVMAGISIAARIFSTESTPEGSSSCPPRISCRSISRGMGGLLAEYNHELLDFAALLLDGGGLLLF